MRDIIEGMELSHLAPTLMGVGLRHSGKATQVSLTRIISSPHNDTALGPLRGGPNTWRTHTQLCLVYSRQGTLHSREQHSH